MAEETIDIVSVVAVVLSTILGKRKPVPRNTSVLTGAMYYEELMATPHEGRFRTVCRMEKNTFVEVLRMLQELSGLTGGWETSRRWTEIDDIASCVF